MSLEAAKATDPKLDVEYEHFGVGGRVESRAFRFSKHEDPIKQENHCSLEDKAQSWLLGFWPH